MNAGLFLVAAVLGSYAAMRLARLANWDLLAAALRFIALWFLTTFFGYGTPIFVVFCLLPVALVWFKFGRKLWQQLVIELIVLVGLVIYSQNLVVPLYLAVLILIDQVLTRALFPNNGETAGRRVGQCRVILIAFSILSVLVVGYVCRHDALRYLSKHDLPELAQFQLQGVPQLWLAKQTLDEGVYWESRFPAATDRCAILFHGADSGGSLQSTARSIFNSLLRLDIKAYGVDHPGFGESPAPVGEAAPHAWNPAKLTAAVEAEMTQSGCKQRYVLGHSQGTTEALRLLTQGQHNYAAVVVMGAGLYEEGAAGEQYWYDRFHTDRRLSERIPFEDWRSVRDRYYRNEAYCKTSPSAEQRDYSKPLLYLVFSNEHANLVRTRERLWSCLDYPNGQRQEFNSGHYLNSAKIGPFTFVSHRQVAAFADVLAEQLQGASIDN